MCARFALFRRQIFREQFSLDLGGIEPHYNIAPTDVVPIIVEEAAGREVLPMQWGLVPGWAKDPSIGQKLINARAETLAEKPSFRTAFKRRRCLVPTDGFYEWKGEKGRKQPYFVHRRDSASFAFAGLWEYWEGPDGALHTFTIVTTVPNELMATVHTRMPVIIARGDYDVWLDHNVAAGSTLMPLLVPCDSDILEMYAVTKAMSNPSYESPAIVEPVPTDTLF